MPKYLIEREVPGAGKMSPEELRAISEKSCEVLRTLPEVNWHESFVTGDRITCVYVAPDEATVREHARRGGFPCDRIQVISNVIDPSTAEAGAPASLG